MIDWSNTHFRYFMRLIVPSALLYTEMQTTNAIAYRPDKSLFYHSVEQPIALQVGGADPESLARCAKLAEARGYAEINLNLGCPSDRVQAGHFGACLMTNVSLVTDCIKAMKDAVSIPVTAKTRIGVDSQDSCEFFLEFIEQLREAGCDKFVVHARKAWLHGLNPKQNRTIPPLKYDYVYRAKLLCDNHPIVINGNIQTLEDVKAHMMHVDGVMVGRLACQNPYALTAMHQFFYPHQAILSRQAVLDQYVQYVSEQFQVGTPLSFLLKPLFNFANGLAFSKRWKALLVQSQQNKSPRCLQQAIHYNIMGVVTEILSEM